MTDQTPEITPEIMDQINRARDVALARFGQAVVTFMGVPRYAHQPISDLQKLCLTPLMKNRIAIASAEPKAEMKEAGGTAITAPLVGAAIWANVSDEVNAKIREQIRAGIFPVKLSPNDWDSGDHVWLLDVIAPSPKLAAQVLGSFKHVLDKALPGSEAEIRLHPVVKQMIGGDVLEKMGARPLEQGTPDKPSNAKGKKGGVGKKVKTRTVKPKGGKSKARPKTKKPSVN